MMKKISILCIFIMISCIQAWAKTTASKNVKNKNEQIEQPVEMSTPDFRAMATFSMPNLQLGITHFNETDETEEIKYSPNVNMSCGIDLSYKGFGFSYSMKLDQAAKDENTYGKTKYKDYQFYYYSDKWGADIYYQRYSGYYLDNPETFGQIQGDSVSIRPDMKMNSSGFNIYYCFNDEMSLNNSMKHVSIKKKGLHSLLLMLSPNYFKVTSDSSLIPPDEEINYEDDSGFRKGEYYSISLSPGYAYTNKFDSNLFLTVIIFGGLGAMQKKYITDSGETTELNSCIKANFKCVFGYETDNFFCGITGLGDGTSTKDPFAETGLELMSYVLTAEVFAGIQF